MLKVVLGLGSNMGDRAGNIAEAVDRLAATTGLNILKVSSFYESPAVDLTDQPDFINAAVSVETDLKPEDLLQAAQAIEQAMGRVKTIDKGPRNIDIDILLYDIVEVRLPFLKVPHPALRQRPFALLPLLEVAPDAVFPTGEPVRWALQDLDLSKIKLVTPSPLKGEDKDEKISSPLWGED
jgi:2-amino-4-hydroxy-6-hydroxymethyldihydropteridine diphosphokinase